MSDLKNEYMIEGYGVYFPYDAYECQLKYMQKVLYSIKNRKNALLESPTGTGKTMCLLASALAYQKHHLLNKGSSRIVKTTLQNESLAASSDKYNLKSDGGVIEIVGIPMTGETKEIENGKNANFVSNSGENGKDFSKSGEKLSDDKITPRVIYSSRTHSQLSQVMRELKSSGIGDGFTIELFDTENDNCSNLINNKSSKQESSTLKKKSVLKGIGLGGTGTNNGCNGNKTFKATILGSRDQLCVHNRVSKSRGNALIKNCRRITKEGKCKYHNNLKQAKASGVAADIRDIEDLKSLALSSSGSSYFCPFYATREIESVCNVVLLPYNYLLDSITRQNLKIDLRNSILILDEAHNLESVAEEAYSYDLRDIDIALSQKAIQNILEATKLGLLEDKEKTSTNNGNRGKNSRNRKENDEDEEDDIAFDIEVAISLVTGLHLLSRNLKNLPCKIPKSGSNKTFSKIGNLQGETYPGKYIYTLFGSSGFGKDNFQQMDECLTNMINYGQNLVGPGGNVSNLLDVTGIQINTRIGALERFQRCLRLTFNDTTMKNPHWFKVYIHYEIDQYMSNDSTNELDETSENKQKKLNLCEDEIKELNLSDSEYRIYLSFWCFSPAAAISSLASSGVRSMIITSGTLSPLDSLSQQFSCSNVSFDVFLENEHVIDSNKQLMAFTVEKGNDNIIGFGSGLGSVQLVGSYESRNNPAYFSALGSVVIDTIRRTPDGVLLFFSSYPLMDQAIKYWNEQGITERLKEFKNVFVEPRSSSELGSVLDSYMDCINNNSSSPLILKKSGSLFIAVCRGKVSEGINFSDKACRGVIIAGLPFPSISDPRVSLKKQYMDESNMDGRQWYNQQAIRAVNQAIGRVVRHKNDYGIIVLADKRFTQFGIYSKLSKWIRSHIKHFPQLNKIQLNQISNFFNTKFGGFVSPNAEYCIKNDSFDTNTNEKNLTISENNNTKLPTPNLSTEISSVLELIGDREKGNTNNVNDNNNTKLIKTITDSSLITPWKKLKQSTLDGTSSVIRHNRWSSTFSFSRSSSSSKENSNCFTIIPREDVSNNPGTTKEEKELFDKTKKIIGEKEFGVLKSHINQIKNGNINSNSLNTVANYLIPSSNKYSLEKQFLHTRRNLALEYLNLVVPLNYKNEFKDIIDNIMLNIDIVNALEKDPVIYKQNN
ncbi:helicase [Cryptosporidium ryanae]|uniref:helicase n=1 Tax=Cryptosporidium ryanae TaxID=515981 RepID=UPI00351A7333|nr:helicase [Cryptosporidium ryanae]